MNDPFDILDEWSRKELLRAQLDEFNQAMGGGISNRASSEIHLLFKLRREVLGYETPSPGVRIDENGEDYYYGPWMKAYREGNMRELKAELLPEDDT